MQANTISQTEQLPSGVNKMKWAARGLYGLFFIAMAGSGISKLTHAEQVVQSVIHLGYPLYLLNILGVSYLLGIIGMLQNKVPWLREWAKAGFTFALLGAFFSHLLAGDPLSVAFPALAILALMLGASALEKKATSHGS